MKRDMALVRKILIHPQRVAKRVGLALKAIPETDCADTKPAQTGAS